jgi:hypothetical protein
MHGRRADLKSPKSRAFVPALPSQTAIVMTRFLLVFLISLPLCVAASSGFGQTNAPLHQSSSADGGEKAHAKKISHKNGPAAGQNGKQNSEEADKAAHLAEGRKKFFDRSMGFDNGGGPDSPVTFDGGNGLTPSAGFKF